MKHNIVFITTLKPMRADFPHFIVEHTNAIKSWQKLFNCNKKIVVVGNDDGTADFCKQYGLIHEIPEYRYNLPLLNSILNCGYKHCQDDDFAIYINADIVINDEFIAFLELVEATFPNLFDEDFYITSQRLDVRDFSLINFDELNWMDNLIAKSTPAELTGIDIMIHRKNMYANMPPFLIGRLYFDTWMNDFGCKKPISINASGSFPMIHQYGKYYNQSGVIERHDLRKNLTVEEVESWKYNEKLLGEFMRINGGLTKFTIDKCKYSLVHSKTISTEIDIMGDDTAIWITSLHDGEKIISFTDTLEMAKQLFNKSEDQNNIIFFENYIKLLFEAQKSKDAYYLYETFSNIKLLSGSFNGYMVERYKNDHHWDRCVTYCQLALENNYSKEHTYKLLHILGIAAYYANEKSIGKKAVTKAVQLYNKDIDIHNLNFYKDV